MINIPTFEILFAICLMVLPEGTEKFTLAEGAGADAPIVWTLAEDGEWEATTDEGATSLGTWTLEDEVVTVQADGEKESTDLTGLLGETDDGYRIGNETLNVENPEDGIWLITSQTGPFKDTVRIVAE